MSRSKILVLFCLSFILGIWLSDFLVLNQFSQNLIFIMLSALIIIVIFFKEKAVRIFSIASILLVLAIFYYHLFLPKKSPSFISFYQGKEITFSGEIVDEPDIRENKINLIVKAKKLENKNLKGKILVTLPRYPEYNFGDYLEIKGEIKEPPIFDEFNYKNYLAQFGVFSIIQNPKEVKKLEEKERGAWFFIKKALFSFKNRFESSLNSILSEPQAAFCSGLLFGIRRAIPEELLEAFIIVGIIHLIALSGYNVTIISKNLSIAFSWLSFKFAFYLALFSVWLFVIMVGAKATIVRAAIMGSLHLLGRHLGRRREMAVVLISAAFLMILENPLILRFDIGFQLSFLATCGLIYLSPIFEKLVRRWTILPSMKEAFLATLGAQIFVLPILLFNFKKLSLIAPLANILILPIIPYTMFFGFLAGFLGIFILPLGQILGFLAYLFLKYIIFISQFLAKIPLAFFETGRLAWFWILIYYLILGFLIWFWNKKAQKRAF